MIDVTAELLRGLCRDLSLPILGELTSHSARERARTAIAMLARLVEKSDIAPEIEAEITPRLREAIQLGYDTLKVEPRQPSGAEEIGALRRAGAALIASVGVASDGDPLDALRPLALADAELCTAMGSGSKPFSQVQCANASIGPIVTAETLTRYLRDRFPEAPSIEVLRLVVQPGGRSKTTRFVSLAPNPCFPEEMVMRQDTGANHIATRVVDEFAVISSLAALDLPLPTPLYCERDQSELGEPFLLMKRLHGRTKGSYFGFDEPVRRTVAEDLAIAMARIHSVDVGQLSLRGFSQDITLEQQMAAAVADRRASWRAGSSYVSPITEYAFLWLHAECRRGLGVPSLIHGDIRAHNLLIENDRISGILDWEFAHIGDPAEDLAYSRPAIEHLMPWDEFMSRYRAAGGGEIDDRRLRFFTVWGLARNASFGAGSMRNYADGIIGDFLQGAVSYNAVSLFERQIAETLLPVLGRSHCVTKLAS